MAKEYLEMNNEVDDLQNEKWHNQFEVKCPLKLNFKSVFLVI